MGGARALVYGPRRPPRCTVTQPLLRLPLFSNPPYLVPSSMPRRVAHSRAAANGCLVGVLLWGPHDAPVAWRTMVFSCRLLHHSIPLCQPDSRNTDSLTVASTMPPLCCSRMVTSGPWPFRVPSMSVHDFDLPIFGGELFI